MLNQSCWSVIEMGTPPTRQQEQTTSTDFQMIKIHIPIWTVPMSKQPLCRLNKQYSFHLKP